MYRRGGAREDAAEDAPPPIPGKRGKGGGFQDSSNDYKKCSPGESQRQPVQVNQPSSSLQYSRDTTPGAFPCQSNDVPKAKRLALAPSEAFEGVASLPVAGDSKTDDEWVDDVAGKRRDKQKSLGHATRTRQPPSRFRPGAFAVQGPNIDQDDMQNRDQLFATPSPDANSYLVAAEAVQPHQDPVQLSLEAQDIENRVRAHLFHNVAPARIVEDTTSTPNEENHKEKTQKCSRRRMILAGLVFILVIIGVVVGTVVGVASRSAPSTSQPSVTPTTSPPSSHPTVFIQACSLCQDGSEPNLQAEVSRGTTCDDLENDLAQLDSPLDPKCRAGQAQGWYSCSCPTLPSKPVAAVCSTLCDVDSRPVAFDTPECRDFETYVEAVALQVDQCNDLIALTPQACRCSPVFDELRGILSSTVSNEADLLNTTTSQYKAMRWLVKDDPANLTIGGTLEGDLRMRYFGALLWFSLGGENWTARFNFLSADDVCDWNDGDNGIFCESSGLLSRVLLGNNALIGTLPGLEFTAFEQLREIRLENNDIRGTIPSVINLLTVLRVFIIDGNVAFGGTVPPEIFEIHALELLWIDSCALVGTLPTNMGVATSLTSLDLQGNNFTGTIPSSISQLTRLTELLINDNNLIGTLPSLSNTVNLRRLFLYGNNLTGTIPSHYGQLRRLERIGLHVNKLTGPMPSFSQNTALQLLYLNNNELGGNLGLVFSTAPSSRLEQVALSANRLTGSLPSNIGSFTALDVLFLYENPFITGTLPTELGLLSDMSSYLNIEATAIDGTLPTELGRMTRLLELDVSGCQLTGTIPTEIGDMASLTVFDMNNNRITGTIPTELGRLQAIEQISLAESGVSGTVPSVLSTLPNLFLFLVQLTDVNGTLQPLCDAQVLTVRADCSPPAEIICECCETCF